MKDKLKPLTLADIAEPRSRDLPLAQVMRRGWRGVWHRLPPRQMTRFVTIGGIRYAIDYRETEARKLLRQGYYEREQIVFFFNEARARGARVFLDVGANFGYYSLLAARLGIFDEIHAFEPHPETYKRLLWHIKANNFDGAITPHNIAASDGIRQMRMRQVKGGNSGKLQVLAGADSPDNAPSGTVVINAAPLDTVLAFRGKNVCVKMDVEGHEMSALDGARELLAHNDSFLQIEIFPMHAERIPAIIARGFSLITYRNRDFYFTGEAQQ